MSDALIELCNTMMDMYISNSLLGYSEKYYCINSIKEDDNYYYISFRPNHPEETPMFVHRFNKENMEREDLSVEQAGFSYDIAKSFSIPSQYSSKSSYEKYLESDNSNNNIFNNDGNINIHNNEKDIFINDHLADFEEYIKDGNVSSARYKLDGIIEKYPDDYRGWFTYLKYFSKDFTRKLYLEVPDYPAVWLKGLAENITYCFNKVDTLINDATAKEMIMDKYETYYEKNKREFEDINNKYKGEGKYVPDIANGVNGLYDETIVTENKIIKHEELREMFEMLNQVLLKYIAIGEVEKKYNEKLDYDENEYSFKDSGSYIAVTVYFRDNTDVRFDNYNDFLKVFDNRIKDIRTIYFHIRLSYSYKYETFEHKESESISQGFTLDINENGFDISADVSSKDNKLNNEYNRIKQIIFNAPEKYTYIIKKRALLSILFSISYGLIPAMLLSILMIRSKELMGVIQSTYVVYPILVIIMSFVIGWLIYFILVSGYYKNIIPDQEYVKYDSDKGKSIYKDNVDKYKSRCEVLIGKNINNLECRRKIENYMTKAKKILPFELLALAIMSVIMLFI